MTKLHSSRPPRDICNAYFLSSASMDDVWMKLMLSPYDYGHEALYDAETRALMQKIQFISTGNFIFSRS